MNLYVHILNSLTALDEVCSIIWHSCYMKINPCNCLILPYYLPTQGILGYLYNGNICCGDLCYSPFLKGLLGITIQNLFRVNIYWNTFVCNKCFFYLWMCEYILFLPVHWYFNWQGCIEHQSLYGNTVNEPSHDEILKWSLEYLDEHFQRALKERRELTAEVKLLQKELKESKGETEQLSNMVNYMKLVSFCYTVLIPWLLILVPVSFYIVS